jgi:hypothetical protein
MNTERKSERGASAKKLTGYRCIKFSISEPSVLAVKMTYTVDHFASWAEKHSTWNSLREWLVSAEGGKLRIVEPKTSPYALIRYVKESSDLSKSHVRWCRSVLIHKESRQIRSVAPPRGEDLSETTTIPETLSLETFEEGTMITIFRDLQNGVTLSTRSRVGAKGRFYDNGPTFESMLKDALGSVEVESLLPPLLASEGSVAVFATVVVRHPENRIVAPVEKPTAVLIHQGTIRKTGAVELNESPSVIGISGPSSLEVSGKTFKALERSLTEMAHEKGQFWQGAVLRDGSGNRYRWRNPSYVLIKNLRGNESNPGERFARLRKTRTLDQYKMVFNGESKALYEMEGNLRKNTRQLFHFYCDVFKARTTQFYRLPWPFKHHVSVLHNMFKNELFKQGKKVDLEVVIRYVNGLTNEDLANFTKELKTDLAPESEKTDVKPESKGKSSPKASKTEVVEEAQDSEASDEE